MPGFKLNSSKNSVPDTPPKEVEQVDQSEQQGELVIPTKQSEPPEMVEAFVSIEIVEESLKENLKDLEISEAQTVDQDVIAALDQFPTMQEVTEVKMQKSPKKQSPRKKSPSPRKSPQRAVPLINSNRIPLKQSTQGSKRSTSEILIQNGQNEFQDYYGSPSKQTLIAYNLQPKKHHLKSINLQPLRQQIIEQKETLTSQYNTVWDQYGSIRASAIYQPNFDHKFKQRKINKKLQNLYRKENMINAELQRLMKPNSDLHLQNDLIYQERRNLENMTDSGQILAFSSNEDRLSQTAIIKERNQNTYATLTMKQAKVPTHQHVDQPNSSQGKIPIVRPQAKSVEQHIGKRNAANLKTHNSYNSLDISKHAPSSYDQIFQKHVNNAKQFQSGTRSTSYHQMLSQQGIKPIPKSSLNISPGPGDYNTSNPFEKYGRYKFNQSDFNNNSNKIPEKSKQYRISSLIVKNNQKRKHDTKLKHIFDKNLQVLNRKRITPGPTSYQIPSDNKNLGTSYFNGQTIPSDLRSFQKNNNYYKTRFLSKKYESLSASLKESDLAQSLKDLRKANNHLSQRENQIEMPKSKYKAMMETNSIKSILSKAPQRGDPELWSQQNVQSWPKASFN